MLDSPVEAPTGIAIHLMDASCERPIKSWHFSDEAVVITIGRSPECSVEVSDPYVSRNHAELRHQDGDWTLISTGRNGVLIGEKPIERHRLEPESRFRLGPNGPTLQFSNSAVPDNNLRTLTFTDLPPIPVLQLDQTKVATEVSQIAESHYFKVLREKVANLRRT